MHEKERELVGLLAKQCKDIGDVQSLLKNLFKGTIEEMLEAEMDDHLRYEKHSPNGDGSGNSRNGYNKKTLKTELGETEIRIPRDRNGKCNPHLIPKYQTKTDDLENRIIVIEAVKKSVYLAIQEVTKKWSMPVRDWGIIIGQLMIFFEDRFKGHNVS